MAAIFSLDVNLADGERRIAGTGVLEKNAPVDITQLESVMKTHLDTFGGIVAVRDRSDFYRTFTVYGMKNVVLKGENVWEKVNILAALSEHFQNDQQRKSYQILISSDGYISSGIGAAPPITSYDNPMEPKYFRYLDDFNHDLGTYLSSAISKLE